MCRNSQNSTFGQIINPKFEITVAISYSTTNFGYTSVQIYTCFQQKIASVIQNFSVRGLVATEVKFFFDKIPRRHILG